MGTLNRKFAMPVPSNGPTWSGMARYPDTNGYYQLHESDHERFPCHFTERCPGLCTGTCGCFACRIATVDDRSVEISRAARARAQE